MSDSLQVWLRQLEQRAPECRIELGLERVRAVLAELPAAVRPRCAVITVGGTNGKGSVVAMLEAMCRAAGLSTLAYSSPHLLDFGERIRLDGNPVMAGTIAAAIETVEHARGPVPLTYFEHVTLAALVVAMHAAPDVMILEVGLGGRLDAVNVIDADVAVMTSIALDHTEWLGPTRLSIGREKAGIARPGRPLIVGERRLPTGLEPLLRETGACVSLAGKDFRWRRMARDRFQVQYADRKLLLPRPALQGAWQLGNAACAIVALWALEDRLNVTATHLAEGLQSVRLPGRLQRVARQPAVWLDVAHNAASARALAAALGPVQSDTNSTAVFSALGDKDIGAMGRALDGCFNRWLVCPLAGPRATPVSELLARLSDIPVAGVVETVESVTAGLTRAMRESTRADRIVVFGSFRTVAEAATMLKQFQAQSD